MTENNIDTNNDVVNNDVINNDVINNGMDSEYEFNLDLFQSINPGDDSLERIMEIMNFMQFQALKNGFNDGIERKEDEKPFDKLLSILGSEYFENSLLNDYIHFVTHYADPHSIETIKNRMKYQCESVIKCRATSRHFRDRRAQNSNVEQKGMASSWISDQFDSIHFMIFHLHELGLRVNIDSVIDENQTEFEKMGSILKEIGKEIETKRALLHTNRWEGGVNSKFTLQVEKKVKGL